MKYNLFGVDFKLATAHCCWTTHKPVLQTTLQCWHDMRKKTSQTCTLQNNINSRVATSKMIDAATMVFEKQNWPYSQGWQTAASILQKNCVTRILHLHAMRLHHCAVWNSQQEITSEINQHERTSLQCSVLVNRLNKEKFRVIV